MHSNLEDILRLAVITLGYFSIVRLGASWVLDPMGFSCGIK